MTWGGVVWPLSPCSLTWSASGGEGKCFMLLRMSFQFHTFALYTLKSLKWYIHFLFSFFFIISKSVLKHDPSEWAVMTDCLIWFASRTVSSYGAVTCSKSCWNSAWWGSSAFCFFTGGSKPRLEKCHKKNHLRAAASFLLHGKDR